MYATKALSLWCESARNINLLYPLLMCITGKKKFLQSVQAHYSVWSRFWFWRPSILPPLFCTLDFKPWALHWCLHRPAEDPSGTHATLAAVLAAAVAGSTAKWQLLPRPPPHPPAPVPSEWPSGHQPGQGQRMHARCAESQVTCIMRLSLFLTGWTISSSNVVRTVWWTILHFWVECRMNF